MKKPNFFIIGAPKCGTTALSEYLRLHKQVYISDPKEIHHFCDDFPGMKEVNNINEYLSIFQQANSKHIAVGEASVWYLYSKVAVREIFNFNPDAKLIIMLRNPVDLVYSMHAQDLNSVDENVIDFKESWLLQDERLAGRHIPKHCREALKLQYRDVGKLGEQLERVYNVFPKDQVKLIFFEDFSSNTRKVYEDVLGFLNVPITSTPESFYPVNKNTVNRNAAVAVFTARPPKILVNLLLKFKILLGIHRLGLLDRIRDINYKERPRQQLEKVFRGEIIDYFRPDVEKLSRLSSIDLSHWNK